jgi:general secretion pathway protein A
MRQLDQRVSIRYQLKPPTRDEAAAYVAHRLTLAGGSAVAFQPKALRLVHKHSTGIPRLVNLICDRALLAAYTTRTNQISADIVGRAIVSLDLGRPYVPARHGWFHRKAPVVTTH